MKTRFVGYLAAAFLILAASASAAPIVGSVNFGSPVANVMIPSMNTATFLGVPSFTVITPATGGFITSLGTTGTALPIPGNGPIAGFLTFNGFTVDVTNFLGPQVWTMVSLPGGVDILGLGFQGIVKKAGFNDTAVTGSITAQYSSGYGANKTVAWSGNIDAAAVPEPSTYGMMFLGGVLIFFGRFAHQKRSRQ